MDAVRTALHQIVTQQGRGVLNRKRCEALLRDHCAKNKREVRAVLMALEEGIPESLLECAATGGYGPTVARLSASLSRTTGLEVPFAKRTVECWAHALGVPGPAAATLRKPPTKKEGATDPLQHQPEGRTAASILLFLNIKGGVAKTTSAIAVAEALAETGRRVLVIDADHQCASSALLLGEARFMKADREMQTLHDLLRAMLHAEFDESEIPLHVWPNASSIRSLDGRLSVIPCSFRINDFETNRAKARRGFKTAREFEDVWTKRRTILTRWLRREYDFTIVDCPPSLAIQVRFMLRACDAYVIPCIPDRISVRGARWLQVRVQSFRAPALGLAWTLYREQNELHKTMVGVVGKRAGLPGAFHSLPKPFSTIIPNSTAVVRGLETDGPFASLAAKYTPPIARVFHSLAKEILVRMEKAAARS